MLRCLPNSTVPKQVHQLRRITATQLNHVLLQSFMNSVSSISYRHGFCIATFTATSKEKKYRVFSQEVPSDITVLVDGSSFSLHKSPLVSKCGYIRKLLWQSTDTNLSTIEIPNLPGGAEAFDLVIKFCYGINFEMNVHNVAMLRCVAEHLEMSEEYAVGNLVGKTETYLTEVALQSLSGAISVLHASENLLPMAESINLVRRCVDAIAYLVFKEAESSEGSQQRMDVDWWAEYLTCLKIEFFRRVLVAMMARGFNQSALAPVLMLYAHKSLSGLVKEKIDRREEQRKRLILESIVSLLAKEKDVFAVSFLSMLLRSSIHLDTTIACRLDLEKRIALQLDQAVLSDLLIASHSGDALFDVDTVKRIIMNYLEHVAEKDHVSPPPCDLHRVGCLMENYLTEIASDRNLSTSKFIGLIELIPKESMVHHNRVYKAIDIFLKGHPDLDEIEMKSLCSLMDCYKLHEAADSNISSEESSDLSLAIYRTNDNALLASDESATLRRENEELKVELLNMKLRLKELERTSVRKPPLPRKSLLDSVSKKLGKLNPLSRVDSLAAAGAKAMPKPSRDRRHSIS